MPRWTPASREKQRQLILTRKPWQHSTGAKTVAGKVRSKMNAVKVLTPEQLEMKANVDEINRILRDSRAKFKELKRLVKEFGF